MSHNGHKGKEQLSMSPKYQTIKNFIRFLQPCPLKASTTVHINKLTDIVPKQEG